MVALCGACCRGVNHLVGERELDAGDGVMRYAVEFASAAIRRSPPHCLTKNTTPAPLHQWPRSSVLGIARARLLQSVRRRLGAVCLRLAAVKRPLLRALEGARLLHPAYRPYEAVRALSAARGVLAPDGLAELRRVVRPGGLLLLATHGNHYRERLTTAERTDYEAGRLVVRWGTAAGTNLCTTFHSPAYIARTLAQDLELLEHESEGAAAGTPWQDVVVLRKPT